ncbi:phosphohydrolase [Nocardia pseudobrasiliensis]|uniref:HD domain-containing protein n=1 Tax=Nocardia pseudobrasiliensis TaxID=45979 RepID=A0A370ICA9_9NOCA|nr:phosphohydrolase [Nocardia pseudobrasiliensis]RDI68347.1 hypothetical protein DFR76_102748 [Nocardia pseudobrasiliensis]
MGAPAGLDWEWAVATGGALTGRQRRQLMGYTVLHFPAMVAGQVRLVLGRRGNGRVDFADLHLPDSRLARAAENEAREGLTPHMLAHSYRTYFFGRALCELHGVAFDDELAYVSSLLHDINLENPTPGRCFAVTGAERAVELATANGATFERAQKIGAAIAAHITPGVADDLGDLGFVSAGAAVDVVGARLWELDPAWVEDLLRRHPRHNFKQHDMAALDREVEAMPEGRIKWLIAYTAFRRRVRTAPFAE